MVTQFGLLASEFSVEVKNINCFAGECHEFFVKTSKGGPNEMKILNNIPPFKFRLNLMTLPSKMMDIYGFFTKF